MIQCFTLGYGRIFRQLRDLKPKIRKALVHTISIALRIEDYLIRDLFFSSLNWLSYYLLNDADIVTELSKHRLMSFDNIVNLLPKNIIIK